MANQGYQGSREARVPDANEKLSEVSLWSRLCFTWRHLSVSGHPGRKAEKLQSRAQWTAQVSGPVRTRRTWGEEGAAGGESDAWCHFSLRVLAEVEGDAERLSSLGTPSERFLTFHLVRKKKLVSRFPTQEEGLGNCLDTQLGHSGAFLLGVRGPWSGLVLPGAETRESSAPDGPRLQACDLEQKQVSLQITSIPPRWLEPGDSMFLPPSRPQRPFSAWLIVNPQ